MAASAGAELQDQCATLRLELKAWEKDFAADNAGRKAGREDIKANADIGGALSTRAAHTFSMQDH